MKDATRELRMNRGLNSQRGPTRSVCLLIFGCLVVFLPVDSFVLSGSKQQKTAVFSTVGKGKSGKSRKKWDDRGGKKPFKTRRPEPSGPRPVLTDYIENRNPKVNEARLSKAINCEHFGTCPGCVVNDQIANIDIIQSARRYFSSTSVRKNRLDVERRGDDWVVEDDDDGFYNVVVPSDVTKWRTQAKLAVASKSSSWSKDGCIFGLYQRASHDVLSIPECQVHHPSINRAVEALKKATSTAGTSAYSRDSREGGLRYVQFQVERTTGKICLTLVWASSELKYTQPALSRLTKELLRIEPGLWHSMWCHCNDGERNNIFSRNAKNWYRLSGPEFIREPLPTGDQGWLYFSPMAFRQGNMDGFDILATDVARAVPGGSKVCELYAGVGLLGLTSLVHHAQPGEKPLIWVRCSDENPANPRCFSRSLDSLPSEITGYPSQSKSNEKEGMTIAKLMEMMESGNQPDENDRSGPRASYMVASASDALRAGQALGAQVLIVDPPRKGLEDEVLDELCKPFDPSQPYVESSSVLTIPDDKVNWTNDIQTLVYVSCGFDALARDCDRLLSSRAGWRLESATGYILFPGSNHVETVCIFQRDI